MTRRHRDDFSAADVQRHIVERYGLSAEQLTALWFPLAYMEGSSSYWTCEAIKAWLVSFLRGCPHPQCVDELEAVERCLRPSDPRPFHRERAITRWVECSAAQVLSRRPFTNPPEWQKARGLDELFAKPLTG